MRFQFRDFKQFITHDLMRQRGEMSIFLVFSEKTRLKQVVKPSHSFNSSYFLVNTAQLRYSKIQPCETAFWLSVKRNIMY